MTPPQHLLPALRAAAMGWPRKLRPSRQTWKWMPGPSPILPGLVREMGRRRELGGSLPT